MSSFVSKAGGFATALVLVGAAALASAAIPDSDDGEVHLCYTKKTTYTSDNTSVPAGTPRIIDYQAGKRCKSSETHLVINQEGPPGPPGPAGTVQNSVTRWGNLAVVSGDESTEKSFAACQATEVVLGGGSTQGPNIRIETDGPGVVQNDVNPVVASDGAEPSGWIVTAFRIDTSVTNENANSFRAYVVCGA